MSKIAEKAAAAFHNQALLEAQKYAQLRGGDISQEIAYGRGIKTGFIQGYEQAEKGTIERVIEWLKANAHKYSLWDTEECCLDYDETECINDFRKAMEEES